MFIYIKNTNAVHEQDYYYEYVDLTQVKKFALKHNESISYIILDGICYKYDDEIWNKILRYIKSK